MWLPRRPEGWHAGPAGGCTGPDVVSRRSKHGHLRSMGPLSLTCVRLTIFLASLVHVHATALAATAVATALRFLIDLLHNGFRHLTHPRHVVPSLRSRILAK